MTLLRKIRAGKSYIRIASAHELALVINYCLDKNIAWGIGASPGYWISGYMPDVDTMKSIVFERYPKGLRMSCSYDSEYVGLDITYMFFSEVCK